MCCDEDSRRIHAAFEHQGRAIRSIPRARPPVFRCTIAETDGNPEFSIAMSQQLFDTVCRVISKKGKREE